MTPNDRSHLRYVLRILGANKHRPKLSHAYIETLCWDSNGSVFTKFATNTSKDRYKCGRIFVVVVFVVITAAAAAVQSLSESERKVGARMHIKMRVGVNETIYDE